MANTNKIVLEFLAKVNQGEMANARNQFQTLKKEVDKTFALEGIGKGSEKTVKNLISIIEKSYKNIEILKAKGDLSSSDAKKYNVYLTTIEQNIKQVFDELNGIKLQPTEQIKTLTDEIKTLEKESRDKIRNIKAAFTGKLEGAGFTDITNITQARAKSKELTGYIQAKKTAGADVNTDADLQQAIASRTLLNKLIKSTADSIDREKLATEASVKALKDQIEVEEKAIKSDYDDHLKEVTTLTNEVTSATQKEKTALADVITEQAKTQTSALKFQSSVGGLESKIASVTSTIYLMRQAWRLLRESFQGVSQIDKEITEIGIVTKTAGEEIWKSFSTFNKAALELSTTTKQYLEGAKIFYQQGMKTAQVMQMVEATTKAAALSSVDFRAASETLTAAINAYNMDASEAMSVTDKFAAVGASSAADFRELSTAMEKVASSAYSAGISFDSLLGILAKGIETTREAPEAIGTALKTIIARFQEMKENPMADLEDGVNANRVEGALKAVGVQLRDTTGEFRNLDDVFADLGETWKTLTRNQKAYVATLAAGSRQQSRFMAIMNNYDRTLQLIQTSANSAGEANAQYAIYTDSVEAAQNRLNNSVEKFQANLMSSENVKAFYNIMSQLVGMFGSLNPLITISTGLITALTVKTVVLTNAEKARMLTQMMSVEVGKQNNAIMSAGAKWLYVKMGGEIQGTAVTWGMVVAQTAYNAAITLGISLLITGAIAAASWIANSQERYKQLKQEIAAQNELTSKSIQEAQSLDSLISRYKDLTSVVNLTTAQEEELKQVKDEILAISPQLLDSIDAEGEKRLQNIEILDTEIKRLKEIAMLNAKASQLKTEELFAGQNDWENAESRSESQQQLFETAQTLQEHIIEKYGKSVADQMQGVFDKVKNGAITTISEFNSEIDTKLTELKSIQSISSESAQVSFGELDTTGIQTGYTYAETAQIQGQIAREQASKIEGALEEDFKRTTQEVFSAYIAYADGMLKDQIAASTTNIKVIYAQRASDFADANKDASQAFINAALNVTDFAVETLKKRGQTAGEGGTALTGENLADYITENISTTTEELYTKLEKFEKDNSKELEEATKKIADMVTNGASISTIKEEIVKTKGKLGIDDDLAFLIFGDLFDTEATERKITELVDNAEKFGFNTIDNLRSKIESMSSSIFTIFTKAVDAGQTEFAQKLIESTDEQRQAIDDAFIEFSQNPKSEIAVKNFINSIMENLKVDEATAKDIALSYQTMAGGALESVKNLYEDINKINGYLQKSTSGALTTADALEMMGGDLKTALAFDASGNAIVSGQALEIERRKKEAELIQTITRNIEELEARKASESGTAADNLEKEINAWEKLGASIERVTMQEQGRIDNQDITSSISAINAATGSLKSYATVFQQIQKGEMSFLDILNAVGNDPDLLFALEATEKGIRLNEEALKDLAQAKLDETKQFVKGEITKLTILRDYLQAAIDGNVALMDANEAGAEAYLNQGASEISLISDIDTAEAEHTKAYLERVQKQINADYQHYKLLQEKAGLAAKSREQFAIDIGDAIPVAEIEDATNILNSLKEKFALDENDPIEIYKQSLEKVTEELDKLNGMYTELDNISPEELYSELASNTDKANDKTEELNDSLEKFYNLLKKIQDMESDLSDIEKRMDLQATGAKEDLALLEQKSQATANLIEMNKLLNQERVKELGRMLLQVKAYNGFVYLQGKSMMIAQAQLSQMLLSGQITQDFYDSVVDFADAYNDLSDSIDETSDAILDLKKQQEDAYDELIEKAIDIRQQMYDILIAADQKELEALEAKYSKMTELENEYLSAVKDSVAKQRAARTEAQEEEDLIAKKRRLATLERDTSGLYTTQAANLRAEISSAELKKKDTEVDKQLSALEQQIKVQQEQRDLQTQMLQEQQTMREETGYYWDRVDATIAAGPNAMLDLLKSSEEYGGADPLSQIAQLETMKENVDFMQTLINESNTNSQNIVDKITDGADNIVNKIGDISAAIRDMKIEVNVSGTGASSSVSGGGGGKDSKPTDSNQGASTNTIKSLQTWLNNYMGYKLAVDGDAGVKTDAAMESVLKSAINTAMYTLHSPYGNIKKALDNHEITYAAKEELAQISGVYRMLPVTKFKKGGIVDYTGPAWVDGTKSQPEAFLDATDTKLIGSLRDFLRTTFGKESYGASVANSSNVTVGDIILNLQNPTNANPQEIVELVKKELVGTMGKIPMTIQNRR